MKFNPNKQTAVRRSDVDRAMFWYEVRLYLKVAGIVLVPFALVLWAMLKFMDRW
jgi:hypothetical protein